MEIKFRSELTNVNYMEEISKFVDTLNKLAIEKGANSILTLNGTLLGFKDGGKLGEIQKQTSKKFTSTNIEMCAQEGLELLGFMVSNVARYGLLSHNLFNEIKSGGKGSEILIGAT